MKKIITFTIFVTILSNCQNSKDKFLIKEGYGLDSITLQTVIKDLPEPIDGIILLINKDNLLYAIDITSKAYYTTDNLSVGIRYETILNSRGMYDYSKVIKKAKSLNKKKKFPISMRYERITFFLDDNGIVEKIRIY